MGALWDVAPPLTWAVLSAASFLLLAGFVLLSHVLVRRNAHGDRWGGLLRAGRLEAALRAGAACLLAGFALWAWELGAPPWLTLLLAASAAAAFGLEAAARARG